VSISSIDLNLISVLHAVLDAGSVARAAARLHVTPSAVSNALARLRDALGDPLVTRKGRGIVPTPRALAIAPALARAMREIEGALAAAPFDAARCTRTFTLAVADVGQVVWVPRFVAAMREAMPNAQLRVVGIDALLSLGDLASSEVDLHLGLPAKGPGIHVEALFEEATVLVGRAKKKLSRRALAELRHVRVDMVPGKGFRDPFAAAFARAGIPRVVAVTVPSYTAAAEVVAATDLVAMMPRSFLAARKAMGLRALDAKVPARAIPVAMCWHERTHADAAARAFREIVRRAVKERQ